jgi:hypothetical protein
MNFADNNIVLILISLVLIYAVLSILVSIVVEWWNYRSQERGKYLRDCIYKLLHDPLNNDYGYLFYNHFTIAGLKSLEKKPPQYISASMFAEAFIDIIGKQVEHAQPIELKSRDANGVKQYKIEKPRPADNIMDRFVDSVELMNTSPFRDLLKSFVDKSGGDYLRMKVMIEQWYNDYMDRVSGWYKGKQRNKLLIAGFLVAIALNVDSVHLLKVLSLDDNLKNRLADQAEAVVDNYLALDSTQRTNTASLNSMVIRSLRDSTVNTDNESLDSVSYTYLKNLMVLNDSLSRSSFVTRDSVSKASIQQLDTAMSAIASLNVPIGWSKTEAPLSWFFGDKKVKLPETHEAQASGVLAYVQKRNASASGGNWLRYLAGIAITGFSLSFGAPFWFELLVKLVNIRRSGKRPEKTPVPRDKD